MADVFTVLAQDHEEVKGMLAELEQGPPRAAGANQDQLARRKKLTEQLIIEESKHEPAVLPTSEADELGRPGRRSRRGRVPAAASVRHHDLDALFAGDSSAPSAWTAAARNSRS
jgi:hypothetical protein